LKKEASAVLVIVIIAGGLGLGYLAGYSNRQTITTTYFISSTQSLAQGSPLSTTNGDWTFSIRIQNSLLAFGGQFGLSYNLTNISGHPQTVHIVNPMINPVIYAENGSEVWAWNPPTYNAITTIPPTPGNWSQPLNFPPSGLPAGRYVLSVWPLIGPNTTSAANNADYSIGESLVINASFTVP
jgi:hypothetical protein